MTNSRFKAIKDQFISGLPDVPQLHQIRQHVASFNPFNESEPSPVLPKSPALDAIDTITGDVVVMGGYRGSILRDTATGRRVWIPLKVGFNLRKIDLELGLNPEDEEMAEHQIYPDGMLKSLSGVDISRRLIRRLKANAAQHDRRVHDWGYDWRLSPALIANRLIKFLETLPCNQLTPGEDPMTKRKGKGAMVIAHSLGGLIVRYAINQRPELFSGVLFAGTPQHCVNILGPLRNGDSVLFNSKVFTAQVNFTLRSSYAFLPEDGTCFVDKRTGESLPVDFYDVENWKKYGLSPCVSDAPLQALTQRSVLGSVTPNILASKEKDIINPGAPQLNSGTSPDLPTIPKSKALPYLERILQSTAEFRRELQFKQHLADQYPAMTVLYSKTTPTVKGAKVDGREGIKRGDVYEELVFGAGDGVCLARAAMLPSGYRCVKKVQVDRGHVALLGEIEGVGECVRAMVRERGW
jgi:pimeloyl-ACP methyl ester carboxylesterase